MAACRLHHLVLRPRAMGCLRTRRHGGICNKLQAMRSIRHNVLRSSRVHCQSSSWSMCKMRPHLSCRQGYGGPRMNDTRSSCSHQRSAMRLPHDLTFRPRHSVDYSGPRPRDVNESRHDVTRNIWPQHETRGKSQHAWSRRARFSVL